MMSVRWPVRVVGGILAVLVAGGCFVADAPPPARIACSSVDECPPTHRCELALGRCLPEDETVPQATPLSATTSEDEPFDVVLQGFDVDGDPLAFFVTPPDAAEGALGDVVGSTVRFTPSPDFSGTATFSYVVADDAGLRSSPATATVTVAAVDDAPFFVAPTRLVVDEDQALQVNVDLFDRRAEGRDADTLQVIDVDTFEIAVAIADAEPDAIVTQQPDGDIVYVPPRDFFGSDDVVITARCGGQTTTHHLEIVVAPENDAPTVDVGDLSTREGEPVDRVIELADVDDAPGELVVEVSEPSPAIGVVEVVAADDGVRLLRFTPSDVGDASVNVRVRDAAGAQVETKVDLHVFATVAAPTARSDTIVVDEDDFAIVDLAHLSRGPAGLSWDIQALPAHGTLDVVRLADGQVTFRPAANYFGADRFVYSVSAPGSSTSVAGAIDIVVAPRPDGPTARNLGLTVLEDTVLGGTLDANDPDGEALAATVTSPPLHGTFDVVGLEFLYEPDPDFAGRDTVDVVIDDDGDGIGADARLTIEVTAVPDQPTANDVVVVAAEDETKSFPLDGGSVDADAALAFAIAAAPEHGEVVIVDEQLGHAAYTPARDYAGVDGFDFVVRSAGGVSRVAHVDVTVVPAPDVPVIAPLADVVVAEDGVVHVPVTATDADGDAVVIEVASAPRRGDVVVEADGSITYTPRRDESGADVVGLRPRDAGARGAVVELHIDVVAVPDAPVADARDVSVVEDGSASFTLGGASVDGQPLSFDVVDPPAHGVVSAVRAAGGVVYRPAADFFGDDVFRYVARDPRGLVSVPAAVRLSVAGVADAPAITARPIVVDEDAVVDVSIPVVDVDLDLVDVVVGAAEHGQVVLDRGGGDVVLTYAPAANFNGVDRVTVTASDGAGLTTAVDLPITVVARPDAPLASAIAASGNEDTTIPVLLSGTSIDGDALSFVVVAPPAAGVVVVNGSTGAGTFTPPPDFSGTTTFDYVVVNTAGLVSAPARATMEVLPVNDAPSIDAPSTLIVLEDRSARLFVEANDADPDDVVSILVLQPPLHGTINAGPFSSFVRLTYTPDADFNGSDFFSLRARDASGATSATAIVQVDIVPVADPPTADPQRLGVAEDGAVPFALSGATVDGGPLRFTISAAPTRGTIEGFDPSRGLGTYRPAADQNGVDSFTFVAVDERGVPGAATAVTVDISAVNDSPVVAARSAVTAEDVTVDVPLTVVDADGDPTTLEIVTNGGKGTATITPGTSTLRYTPRADANGSDVVVVAARDAAGRGASASITITIIAVPDPPRATAVTAIGSEDASVIVQLAGTSADGEAVAFSIVNAPSRGVIESFNPTTGVALYRGRTNLNGIDSFVFTASTATQTGTSATATIVVQPVNDPPTVIAPGGTFDVVRDGLVTSANFETSDIDGDAVGFAIVQPPFIGTAFVEGGAITYRAPSADSLFVGVVSVFVVAVDPAGAQSAPVSVAFRVVVDDDCASLRNSGVSASGIYAIKHAATRCDMSADGGGWTMVAKIVDRWRFDDVLWTNNELFNPEELDPLPAIDAKLSAWAIVPPPDAIRVETFDSSLQGRQRIVLDVSGGGTLVELFDGRNTTPTSAGIASWRTTFAPREGAGSSFACVREGAHVTNALVESTECRLCAFGSTVPAPGDKCVEPTQAYGLGVSAPLSVNAGATGTFDERRRAVVWVRSTDFTHNFPDEKSCEAHASRGRVLSGLYLVERAPTFCAF